MFEERLILFAQEVNPLFEVSNLLTAFFAYKDVGVIPGLLDDFKILSLLNLELLSQLLVLSGECLHVLCLTLHLGLLRSQLSLKLPLHRFILKKQGTEQVATEQARHPRGLYSLLRLQVKGLVSAPKLVLSELGR